MLLHSTSDNYPNGLANSSGLVGKNLMFHVYAFSTGFFEHIEPTYKGVNANILMSQEFYETVNERGFYRGYTYQMTRSLGPVHTAKSVSWGNQHHEEFDKKFGKTLNLGVIGDDLPEEHNSVVLDEKLKDSHGIPAPKINYRVSRNSRKLLDHSLKNAETVFREAGAYKVENLPLIENGGWHLMGTARMGNNPETSVVNRECQSHDLDNLFIVDGSVFVTGAAVNPTPTIQAIALRTSDYIINKRQDLKS